MRSAALALVVVLAASVASGKVYRFDFGDEKSPVQEGFVQITPKSKFNGDNAGWAEAGKLVARDKAYTDYAESHRGKTPPPVWTCPLSQDAIVSEKPAEFAAKVEPGKYRAWVLCGTSFAYRAQVFDFDIACGKAVRAVRFENSYQYRHIFLDVDASQGEARFRFTPRSLFVVAGIVLWQEADEKKVQAETIGPLREILDFMPPAEFARWKLEPHEDPALWDTISEADRKRGYLIHHRHWAEVVYPNTVPIAQEINPELRAFASLGEYEPLNFIVYALRSFPSARVTVSDLKTGQATIPASAIEIRRVRFMKARPNYTVLHRYRIVPDPLMPLDPDEPLAEKENARYWLTVHVPPDARPGMYQGAVTFAPQGSEPATIPIRLRVLPITLQEDPDKIYGIYYYDPLDDWSNAKDEVSKAFYLQKSEWEMQDLVAHGTRNVVSGLSAAPEKPGEPGKFEFNLDLMQKKIDAWRRHGLEFPVVLHVNAGGIYRKYAGKDLGSHISDAATPPPGYGQELTRMCLAIEAERKKRGWPEFLYYPIDEPSTSPGAIAFMIETLKAVRAAGVRTYVTADPTHEGFAPLKPYIDVWCTQPFLPAREEILADKARRAVDYWCYPNHVNGENDHTTVNGARMTYGFGFWRSGFTALIPWIYRANVGNPWNYLDGSSSDFFNRTEDSGRPVPVALWEAYREGYDDYRYVTTLRQLIAEGIRRGGEGERLAREAQRELDYVWNQIRVQAKYKEDDLWEPREADAYRWLIASQILRLQEAGAGPHF